MAQKVKRDYITYKDLDKIIDKYEPQYIMLISGRNDGKSYADKDKLLLEVNKAICNNLKALEQEHRWIPVTERLPEEYGEYMITWTTSHSMVGGKYGLLGIAEYESSGEYDHENNRFKGEWILEDYINNYPNVKVTAWRPLPEPYKAESEEENGTKG